MAKRVVKYGLKEEVLEKAKRMCGKNFEDWECPEFEEIKRNLARIEKIREKLKKYIGEEEIFPFKEGQTIFHPRKGVRTRILRKYKDLLGNDRVLTDFTEKHIRERINAPKVREWRKFARKEGRRLLAVILKKPDFILYDREGRAIVYARKIQYSGKYRMAGVVVGMESKHYIFTVEPMVFPPSQRYDIIYDRKEDGEL